MTFDTPTETHGSEIIKYEIVITYEEEDEDGNTNTINITQDSLNSFSDTEITISAVDSSSKFTGVESPFAINGLNYGTSYTF